MALAIVDRDSHEFPGKAVTAGIAGSLVGKLLLDGRGLSTHNRRGLLITNIIQGWDSRLFLVVLTVDAAR